MIQLGSILAVVWLYRSKIVGVIAGLGDAAGGPSFRRRHRGRDDSGAARRSAASPDYVKSRPLREPARVRGRVHRWRHRHAGRRAVRPAPTLSTRGATRRCRARSASASVRCSRSFPGVSRSGATIVGGIGDAARQAGGGRVLVFRGDADDVGGVRARAPRGARTAVAGAGRRDRGWLPDGVHLVAAHHQAVPGIRRRDRVRAVRVVSNRPRRAAARGRRRRGGCEDDVVASPPVRHRVLRPGAAGRQHRCAHLGIPRRRRASRRRSTSSTSRTTTAAKCRPGLAF